MASLSVAVPVRAAPLPAALYHPVTPPGVELGRCGEAVVLRFNTPHPGCWSAAFQEAVVRLVRTCREEAVDGRVVLTGPRLFVGRDEAAGEWPDIGALVTALGGPGAPVVAAIPGLATGIGLEVALACAARVATAGGRFALPEVTRGQLPVNGAVERLPGLIGLAPAVEMIAFGTALPAATALRVGLVDAIAEPGGLERAAAGLALGARAERKIEGFVELRAAVLRRAPGQAAPLAAVHALDQARRPPLYRSLAQTRRLAQALAGSPEARALRYAAGNRGSAEGAARLRWGLLRAGIHLLDAGASPLAVDRALLGFGFTVPPFATADREGLPAVIAACVDPCARPWHLYSPTLDLLVDAGRTGLAAGRGWYRYGVPARQPQHDPELDRLLDESARARQQRRREIASADIVAECLAALLAVADEMLADGSVADGRAVDALSVAAVGFPRWRGGLWYFLAESGFAPHVARLAALHAARGVVPAPGDRLLALG